METCTAGLSIGCNAVTHVVSWSTDGVLAYGASNAVAIYDPTAQFGVETTLMGHTARVTAVRWLGSETLVSGSSDASLRLWRKMGGRWQMVQTIQDHTKSISTIAVYDGYLVSGAMDGTIILYRYEAGGLLQQRQIISYKPALPLALAIARLPGTESLILAVGGTTTKISIYASTKEDGGTLELKANLPGHEDWIRAFDFLEDDGTLLLASASQDRYIRLWRIDQRSVSRESAALADGLGDLVLLENKAHDFVIPDGGWKVCFEALLVSHEDWIFSVDFSRDQEGLPILLSSSADSSIILWYPDVDSQIWTVQAQLGTISTKGASTATGSTGGFWGALFSPRTMRDRLICAWNKTGSIRIWQREDGTDGAWRNVGGVGGHVKQVRSLSWSPGGEYFLTTSLDQSTRLWAEHNDGTWKEFARPQIHGYDIQSIHVITPALFISGAEEKIVRIFQATSSVVDMLARVAGIDFRQESTAEAANVPALGLSNKALTSTNQGTHLDRSDLEESVDKDSTPISKAMLDTLNKPPTEDHLQRHTLFPELEKLYGHGYEIQALTASHDGRFIVSGCRATTPEHAVLRAYDAHKYKELAVLEGHTLTVTKARFSEDDRYLLSVSRDRTLCLYRRTEDGDGYVSCKKIAKAHKRIIWDCAWLRNDVFATASRDGTACLWRIEDGADVARLETIKVDDASTAVTAVAWSPADFNAAHPTRIVLALGCEDGSIRLYTVSFESGTCQIIEPTTIRNCAAAITGLGFRNNWSARRSSLELAYCSEDCTVGVTKVSLV